MQQPSVGRVVHYVSYGTPGGEYASKCRAAMVTGLGEPLPYPVHGDGIDDLGPGDAQLADLCVLNPTGMFFREGVPQHEGDAGHDHTGAEVPARSYRGGTWHWAEHS